jgi:hypothetical protein
MEEVAAAGTSSGNGSPSSSDDDQKKIAAKKEGDETGLVGKGKVEQKNESERSNEEETEEDSSVPAEELREEEVSNEPSSFTKQLSEGGGEMMENLARLRREKRLAMNRESARARRKKKKVLIESLETEVAELTKSNQTLQLSNDTLAEKVRLLETELAVAQSVAARLAASSRLLASGSASSGLPSLGIASSLRQGPELQQRLLLQNQMAQGVSAPSSSMGATSSPQQETELQRFLQQNRAAPQQETELERFLLQNRAAQEASAAFSGLPSTGAASLQQDPDFQRLLLQNRMAQGTSGLPLSGVAAQSNSLTDDPILRSYLLESQAFSQAARDGLLSSRLSPGTTIPGNYSQSLRNTVRQ